MVMLRRAGLDRRKMMRRRRNLSISGAIWHCRKCSSRARCAGVVKAEMPDIILRQRARQTSLWFGATLYQARSSSAATLAQSSGLETRERPLVRSMRGDPGRAIDPADAERGEPWIPEKVRVINVGGGGDQPARPP
jgi:hypothetical protein